MITLFKAIEHTNLDKYKKCGYYIAHMQPLNSSRLPSDICDTPNFDKRYVYDLEIKTWSTDNNTFYYLFIIPYYKYQSPILIASGTIELYEDKPTREQVLSILEEME